MLAANFFEFCVVCEIVGKCSTEYDAMGCKPCNMFFRNTIKDKLVYRCGHEGKCNIIGIDGRKSCKACRWKKCIHKGMKPEKVQVGIRLLNPMYRVQLADLRNYSIIRAIGEVCMMLQEAVITQLGYRPPQLSPLLSRCCEGDPEAVTSLEEVLLPVFKGILQQPLQRFFPRMLRAISLLFELHPETVPERYKALFPCLLSPTVWEHLEDVKPLVRLLQAFIEKGVVQNAAASQVSGLLWVYEMLQKSNSKDSDVLKLLASISNTVPNLPDLLVASVVANRPVTETDRSLDVNSGFASWCLLSRNWMQCLRRHWVLMLLAMPLLLLFVWTAVEKTDLPDLLKPELRSFDWQGDQPPVSDKLQAPKDLPPPREVPGYVLPIATLYNDALEEKIKRLKIEMEQILQYYGVNKAPLSQLDRLQDMRKSDAVLAMLNKGQRIREGSFGLSHLDKETNRRQQHMGRGPQSDGQRHKDSDSGHEASSGDLCGMCGYADPEDCPRCSGGLRC